MPDEICTLIGWPQPPDRTARLRRFCDAYGLDDPMAMLDAIERRIEAMAATGTALAAIGEPPYGDEWLRVIKPRLTRDLTFVRAFPRR